MPAPGSPGTELTPELIELGLQLSPDARFRFVMRMLESMEPSEEVLSTESLATKTELTRRFNRIQTGDDVPLTLDEAMTRIQRK